MAARRVLNKDGTDPFGTEQMPIVIPDQSPGETQKKKRYVKPEGYGKCPGCMAPRVALMKSGNHIVWKEHTKATYGRARFICHVSGSAFCQTGEGVPSLNADGFKCLCGQRKAS